LADPTNARVRRLRAREAVADDIAHVLRSREDDTTRPL